MNNFLCIRIKDVTKEKIITKFSQINVNIYNLEQKQNYIYIKVKAEDYEEKIEKYLRTLEFEKVQYTGPKYFKLLLKKYRLLIILMLFSLGIVCLASQVIVDIQVIHDDEKIVDLIKDELGVYGITKFTFRKNFDYLQKVKKEIKNKHTDKIDWLEINKVGMRYIIRVEERIISSEPVKNNYCNVYALKDGLITKIKTYEGESIVNINDYVKSGALLIGGDIHLNEEVVEHVCASGEVYAEAWYTINVKVPFEYYESQKTGKKRNNIIINYKDVDYQLFKDRLKDYESSSKIIFDLAGIKIYLRTDEEIKKTTKIYTEEEALAEAQKLARDKVKVLLKGQGDIIEQKVLQKRIKDSTIDVDIFIVAEELISVQKTVKEEEKNDL